MHYYYSEYWPYFKRSFCSDGAHKYTKPTYDHRSLNHAPQAPGVLDCRAPMVFAIDMEGVLTPEIWPVLGEHFDVPELHWTTRDLADFDELMRRRVAAVRGRGLSLRDLQDVAHSVEPFLGAREFLSRLRLMGQVVIISDTFHELAEPLVQKLGGHSLFANRFHMDGGG